MSLIIYPRLYHHTYGRMLYIYIYIYSQSLEKSQLDFNWILNFALCVSFNFKFFAKRIIEYKNQIA